MNFVYWELPVLKIATVYMYVCIIKAAHIYRTFLFGILETLIANLCAVFLPVFYCINKKFCTVYKQTKQSILLETKCCSFKLYSKIFLQLSDCGASAVQHC